MHEVILFSGTANRALAAAVARQLDMRLGECQTERFPDGELVVRLLESVRRKEVVVIQPTCPPVNDHLVELLAFADACRRSSAARVTAVVPYFGYARADRRNRQREPILGSVAATLMQAVGIDHVITIDPHTPQMEGFFDIPVDSLSAVCPIADAMKGRLAGDVVVVSPDGGRVPLATEYARLLDAPLAVLHKRRDGAHHTEVTHLIGEVEGRACLIIDDMISTGGTLARSIEALAEAGAREFTIAATHGLFIDDALEKLAARHVREVWVTDTVPQPATSIPPVRVVSAAPLLAEAIRREL